MKEARTLSQKYEVLILGWDREKVYSRSERIKGNILLKRCPLKAPYGSFTILLFYPIFWVWVITNLLLLKPDAVHACDLDALIPAKIYSILKRTRIVYDNFDKFAMAFIPPQKRIVNGLADWLEDVLAYKSDLLILVSSNRLSTFRWVPKNTIFVLNCPEDYQYGTSRKTINESEKHDDFVLVYAGVISDDRGLLLLEKAITNIDEIQFLVAGRPVSNKVLNQLLLNPKVEYLGVLSPDKAIELEAKADAIPLLYDPQIPINKVASPNKLFEAMMLRKPVISNICTEIVSQVKCGLIVEYDYESVEKALLMLVQSPKTQLEMGDNGRTAFESKYNWNEMKKRLLEGYGTLEKESGGVE